MNSTQSAGRQPGYRFVGMDASNFDTLPCCGIKDPSHPGRNEKRCWLQANAQSGVKAKTLVTEAGEPAGYIEYAPGESAWRGIDAPGYLVIHCIWTYPGHRQEGCGRLMVDACLGDARAMGRSGVAVVVRKGPWMADRRLFTRLGFESSCTAPPDFELLVRRLDPRAALPGFRRNWEQKALEYGHGLTILRSQQCPHIAKFVADIAGAARNEYRLDTRIVDLETALDAQSAPTPFGVFALILNGKLLADHPISRTRFRNIMKKLQT